MNASQFLHIIKARFWLILFTLLITVSTSIVVTFLLPKEYTASTTLIIDRSGHVVGSLVPAQLTSTYMATQIDIIQSHKVAKKVVIALKLDQNESTKENFFKATKGQGDIKDWLADVLLKKIEVIPSRESQAVIISYTASKAQFSAAIANAFAAAYSDANLELSVEPAKKTALWFDRQLVDLRKKVKIAQKKMSDYQQEHGIFATEERLDIETARLTEFTQQMVTAEAATRGAESKKSEMDKLIASAKSLESLAEVQNNSFIQNLKIQLLAKETVLLDMTSQYGTRHPQYIRARKDVGGLRSKLKREIKKITESVNNNLLLSRSTEKAIRADAEQQRKKIMKLKQSRNELPILEREVLSAQNAFESALQRLNDNTMQSRMSATNISILNLAIAPVKPSSPKMLINVILSFFLGGIIGLGLAFIRELMDKRIRSEADLTEGFKLHLLGTLEKETV